MSFTCSMRACRSSRGAIVSGARPLGRRRRSVAARARTAMTLAATVCRGPADDLHHDVRPRAADRLGEPGAGLPRPDGPPEVVERAGRGAAVGPQPVRPRPRRPRAARGDRASPAAPLRHRPRPRPPRDGHRRRHRGDRRRRARAGRPRRRGRGGRALLRRLPRVRRDGRRRRRPVPMRRDPTSGSTSRRCAPPSPTGRSCCWSTPRTTPPAPSSTRAERAAIAEVAVRHDVVVVVDEVYEHLTFDGAPARAAGDRAGDGRAHPVDLQRRQDLLVHRLEGGLGDRHARSWSRAVMAAKQWLTFTNAAPAAAGHRLRPGPRGRRPPRAGRRPRRAPRPALRRAGRPRAGPGGAAGHLLHARPTSRTSAGPTAWRSAGPCPSGPASWRSPLRRSTTTRTTAGTWSGGPSASSAT